MARCRPGRQARGQKPRDRRDTGHGARVRRRRDEAGHRRGACRVSRLGGAHREGSRDAAATLARPDARQRRRSRDAHDRRAGQAARRVEGRDRLRGLVHRVVRRGRQAPVRRRHPGAPARQAHRRPAPAGRRRRRDHAVEFPGRDDHPQVGSGARRRLHLRLQAGDADALLGARDGRARATRRHSARRVQRDHGPRERDRRRDDVQPRRAQAHLHRLDRDRQEADGRSARAR